MDVPSLGRARFSRAVELAHHLRPHQDEERTDQSKVFVVDNGEPFV
jgi:hypothetical protein